mmetsp:Transcript_378/g.762  ORF Transcript_378/g.762 Transcript_378/m.762 type:complete len:251 (-) Transcript_378:218-970(-)
MRPYRRANLISHRLNKQARHCTLTPYSDGNSSLEKSITHSSKTTRGLGCFLLRGLVPVLLEKSACGCASSPSRSAAAAVSISESPAFVFRRVPPKISTRRSKKLLRPLPRTSTGACMRMSTHRMLPPKASAGSKSTGKSNVVCVVVPLPGALNFVPQREIGLLTKRCGCPEFSLFPSGFTFTASGRDPLCSSATKMPLGTQRRCPGAQRSTQLCSSANVNRTACKSDRLLSFSVNAQRSTVASEKIRSHT